MKKFKICIVGLGYVGLPLAVKLNNHFSTIGLDLNKKRIDQLNHGRDLTLEISDKELEEALAKGISFTTDYNSCVDCNIYIVTVPTPVTTSNVPDLKPLKSASESIGKILKKGDIVIYESTTYPGCTEEYCVPILENISGLTFGLDFKVGYSPERINPGDKVNTLENITKVISGSDREALNDVYDVYSKIIKAGLYKASSIKVAEASKAIENAQRDLNISFMNELAIIFNYLDIDTTEVIKAASTKWNFLTFSPGLVGGHCISVDPYYLAYKASQVGYDPQVILSGRRVNNSIPKLLAEKCISLLLQQKLMNENTSIAILGVTFKENCPDIRNSMVFKLNNELTKNNITVHLFDPLADRNEVKKEYNCDLHSQLDLKKYGCIILAVPHEEYLRLNLCKSSSQIIIDVKSALEKDKSNYRL